jgi:hypothetical protein
MYLCGSVVKVVYVVYGFKNVRSLVQFPSEAFFILTCRLLVWPHHINKKTQSLTIFCDLHVLHISYDVT